MCLSHIVRESLGTCNGRALPGRHSSITRNVLFRAPVIALVVLSMLVLMRRPQQISKSLQGDQHLSKSSKKVEA